VTHPSSEVLALAAATTAANDAANLVWAAAGFTDKLSVSVIRIPEKAAALDH
jgi:hypothetical protein